MHWNRYRYIWENMGKRASYGEILREWRIEMGFTQEHLADLLDITQGSVCAYETNNRKPQVAIAVRIDDLSHGKVPMRAAAG